MGRWLTWDDANHSKQRGVEKEMGQTVGDQDIVFECELSLMSFFCLLPLPCPPLASLPRCLLSPPYHHHFLKRRHDPSGPLTHSSCVASSCS